MHTRHREPVHALNRGDDDMHVAAQRGEVISRNVGGNKAEPSADSGDIGRLVSYIGRNYTAGSSSSGDGCKKHRTNTFAMGDAFM